MLEIMFYVYNDLKVNPHRVRMELIFCVKGWIGVQGPQLRFAYNTSLNG
jgi:hypothetical protein